LLDRAAYHLTRQSPGTPPSLHKNYDPALPLIEGDAELLERVFFNLLQNAVQASAADATVTLKTRAAGGGVEVAILDRGAGIKAEDLEQIFNPFFTTKPGGVGLGLAISAKIVDEHGGRIRVESEIGRGSTFLVTLPAGRPEAQDSRHKHVAGQFQSM
jgi:signal transduction histidine kinase